MINFYIPNTFSKGLHINLSGHIFHFNSVPFIKWYTDFGSQRNFLFRPFLFIIFLWVIPKYATSHNHPQPSTTTHNHPQPSTTIGNHAQSSTTTHNHPQLSTTIHNYPQPSTTTHNHPQPSTTIRNHPQQPRTTHNRPKPSTITHNHPHSSRTTKRIAKRIKKELILIFAVRVFLFVLLNTVAIACFLTLYKIKQPMREVL